MFEIKPRRLNINIGIYKNVLQSHVSNNLFIEKQIVVIYSLTTDRQRSLTAGLINGIVYVKYNTVKANVNKV